MEAEAPKQTKCQHHHGKAIKQLRLDRGWSRRIFADKIGVSEASLIRMEAKEELPDEVLEKMAKELGVTIDLIKELEEDKPLAFYIQENTFDNHSSSMLDNRSSVNVGSTVDNRTDGAVEEMAKVCEHIRHEYEILFATQKEMMEFYKKEMENLLKLQQNRGADRS